MSFDLTDLALTVSFTFGSKPHLFTYFCQALDRRDLGDFSPLFLVCQKPKNSTGY